MKKRRILGKGTPVVDVEVYNLGWGAQTLRGSCPHCGTSIVMYYCPVQCSVCHNPIKWKAPKGIWLNVP